MSLSLADIVTADKDRRYTLKREGCNAGYYGARFVDGVAENVPFRAARRLKAAFGREVEVTYYQPPAPPAPAPAARPKKKAPARRSAVKKAEPIIAEKPESTEVETDETED
jgi:hypothetical protein